jgi:hypothetical protein
MPLEDGWPAREAPTADHHLSELDDVLGDGTTAVVLDLEPVTGVEIAATLSQRRHAHAVLVLPRWPHPEATLPTSQLIATLVEASRRLKPGVEARHVVFVLDGERSKSIDRAATDSRVDNRYDLAIGDLPNLERLRAAGVERIVKLSHARPS